MRLTELPLAGAFVVDLVPAEDGRGFFARSWCGETFARHGLDGRLAQCNVSFNRRAGTVRGMHFQAPPHEEAKLVRCTQGAIHDVIVDLRPDSPTYLRWEGVELSATNRRGLYVPAGFAHGFQTLTDDAEVFYQMSTPFQPGAGRGLRWDDPAVNVRWPRPVTVISEKDQLFPLLQPGAVS